MNMYKTPNLIQTLASTKRYAGLNPKRKYLKRSTQWIEISGSIISTLNSRLVTGFGNIPTIVNSIKMNSARAPTDLT